MNNILRDFIARVWLTHCEDCHNADFEVCQHPVCWLAYRLECGLDWLRRGRGQA